VSDNIVVQQDQGLAYDGGLPLYDGIPIPGLPVYNFFFQLLGPRLGAVPDEKIPTTVPRLGDFFGNEVVIAYGGEDGFFIRGVLTDIEPLSLSPRAEQEQLHQALNDLLVGVTNRPDRAKLLDALSHLTKAVAEKNWLDESHPEAGARGETMFNENKSVVGRLRELRKANRSGLSSALLQEHIDNLVEANRQLAVIAIEEALARLGKGAKIKAAQNELRNADAAAAKDKPDDAIERYRNAWKAAVGA
jgi:hypothetical protein